MADHVSPSPMIEVFVRAVTEQLPAEQQQKLEPHRPAIARTTDRGDGRRARHCAHWAIGVAGEHDLPHPEWRRIKETHEVWKEAWLGSQFALMLKGAGRPAPVADVEIEWVEGAVDVARMVGENVGWEQAPWEDLLVQLIAMEGDGEEAEPDAGAPGT